MNDWLLKVNDVDLANKDRKQVIKAVLSGEGVINMVVRRRKSLGGRIVTPIQINLVGHKGQRSRPKGSRRVILVYCWLNNSNKAVGVFPH